jgi:glutamate/tyrosine decarboxylase-like PLP-dependent enzyme
MMGITQQCSALLVRDPSQLGPCFATGADYLFQPDKLNAHLDSGDRHFQCARRIDSAKLWLTWNASGDDGFAARVDHAFDMAAFTRSTLRDRDEFAVVVEGSFTNVVFVWVPPELRPLADGTEGVTSLDAATHERLHALPPKVKSRMQADGIAMLGYQPVHGINTYRFLFMNPMVAESDVADVLDYIAKTSGEEWAAP